MIMYDNPCKLIYIVLSFVAFLWNRAFSPSFYIYIYRERERESQQININYYDIKDQVCLQGDFRYQSYYIQRYHMGYAHSSITHIRISLLPSYTLPTPPTRTTSTECLANMLNNFILTVFITYIETLKNK